MINDPEQIKNNKKPLKLLIEDNKNTTDFIESDPMTIDVKMDGADKIKDVSLDIVGGIVAPFVIEPSSCSQSDLGLCLNASNLTKSIMARVLLR